MAKKDFVDKAVEKTAAKVKQREVVNAPWRGEETHRRYKDTGHMTEEEANINSDIAGRDFNDLMASERRGATKLQKMAGEDARSRMNKKGWIHGKGTPGLADEETSKGFKLSEAAEQRKRLVERYRKQR